MIQPVLYIDVFNLALYHGLLSSGGRFLPSPSNGMGFCGVSPAAFTSDLKDS